MRLQRKFVTLQRDVMMLQRGDMTRQRKFMMPERDVMMLKSKCMTRQRWMIQFVGWGQVAYGQVATCPYDAPEELPPQFE